MFEQFFKTASAHISHFMQVLWLGASSVVSDVTGREVAATTNDNIIAHFCCHEADAFCHDYDGY